MDEILQYICDESNKYAIQTNPNKPPLLTKNKQFNYSIIYDFCHQNTSAKSYWEFETRYGKVAEVMSHNRFLEIKWFIHCNDNMTAPQPLNEPLYEIRPIINHLQVIFKKFKAKEYICKDEQMVSFRGWARTKQYNANKPKKWGYKLYVLCDDKGLVYNFEVHTGKIEVSPNQPDIGASGDIVSKLLENVEQNKGYKIGFIGVQDGISLSGTIRNNRLTNCKMPNDNDLKEAFMK